MSDLRAVGRRPTSARSGRAGRAARAAVLVAALLSFAACTTEDTVEPDATPAPVDVGVDVTGRWTGPGTAYLDVDADGAALGSDGCNRLEAELSTVDESTGRFRVTSSTEALCPDVPSWIDARGFSVVDDELVVESADGESLTTLTRD